MAPKSKFQALGFWCDWFVPCTAEDRSLVRMCLEKVDRSAGNTWRSLLDGQYEANAYLYDQMQQKMTLERFQTEV